MPLAVALAACSGAEEGKGEGSADGADGGADGGADDADGGGDDAATNRPPSAPTVQLSPAAPTTTQDVSVVIASAAVDPDGDIVSYRYLWSQDGAPREDLTGDTLPAAETRKGQRWTVTVVPTDGALDGGEGAASATVVNTPPSATVSLPPAADAGADLVASAAGLDDDDVVELRFAWTVDGDPTGWAEASVPATALARGQVWAVTVTPNDGEADGALASAELTIGNALPVADALTLTPSPAFEDSVLQAVVVGAYDADGDAITAERSWWVNGLEVVGEAGDTLDGAAFAKGDTVQARVVLSDGLGAAAAIESALVTVENSAPGAPLVAVRPAAPVEGEALVCALLTEATDIDGDSLSYTFTWEVDGVPYLDAVDTILSGDTVAAGETLAGEAWTCGAEANDGAASGGASVDTVEVEAACVTGGVAPTAAGIGFVTVCASSFDMGCTPGQAGCAADESPVMPVTLTRDYHISRAEITQGQFEGLMGYNPASARTCGSWCPVERVSWHMAAAFANAVSSAEGLASCYTCTGSGITVSCTSTVDPYTCAGYRLPTEAEWEGAARCGEDLRYAGSDSADDVAWYVSNTGREPHEVSQRGPNACGLDDMSGNVSEWVHDWYVTGYYTSAGRTDPTGPASGSSRIFRGGSWRDDTAQLRVAFRARATPAAYDDTSGLRLARTAP